MNTRSISLKLVILLLALSLCGAGAAFAQKKKPIDVGKALLQSYYFIEKHQYKKAEALLNKILAEEPGNPLALNNLASIMVAEKKFGKADTYLNQALLKAKGYTVQVNRVCTVGNICLAFTPVAGGTGNQDLEPLIKVNIEMVKGYMTAGLLPDARLGPTPVPPSMPVLPSVTPPPPPPGVDRLGRIDRILENLQLGNIAFNAQRSMNLHTTSIIHLLLGLSAPIDELKGMIKAEGDKEGARIRVSDRMEARLSGPNFGITAITDEIQLVSRSYITEWQWEVKPTSRGRNHLHLTLSALITIDGVSTPRVIRTFDKIIDVEVNWHDRVFSFFENNWQWLWTAILIPIAAWLWKRKKRIKSSAS